jgi:hypothetical protein
MTMFNRKPDVAERVDASGILAFMSRIAALHAQSVNRGFAPIGDYSIAGVVNAASLKPYWTLQSTSLYRVMGMAKEISIAIGEQWRVE